MTTDHTFAEATVRKLEEQERELAQLRIQVAAQAATIRSLQEANAALQLMHRRVKVGLTKALDTLTRRG